MVTPAAANPATSTQATGVDSSPVQHGLSAARTSWHVSITFEQKFATDMSSNHYSIMYRQAQSCKGHTLAATADRTVQPLLVSMSPVLSLAAWAADVQRGPRAHIAHATLNQLAWKHDHDIANTTLGWKHDLLFSDIMCHLTSQALASRSIWKQPLSHHKLSIRISQSRMEE